MQNFDTLKYKDLNMLEVNWKYSMQYLNHNAKFKLSNGKFEAIGINAKLGTQ